jgi:hypothetical protein
VNVESIQKLRVDIAYLDIMSAKHFNPERFGEWCEEVCR